MGSLLYVWLECFGYGWRGLPTGRGSRNGSSQHADPMPAPVRVKRLVPQRISVVVMAVISVVSTLVVLAVQILTGSPGARVSSQVMRAPLG
jgi:hypothetical protein